MYRTPENILSSGKIIYQGEHEFMPKKYAVEAVETARLEVAEFFINLSGIFGHYKFFTNELWRKVKGFKKADKGEIIAVFLHYWFHNKFGFNTCPCGSSWFAEFKDQEFYDEYIEKYKPVLQAYNKWCVDQR